MITAKPLLRLAGSWQSTCLPGVTISRQIGLIFLFLMLVGLANVAAVRFTLERLGGVADTINVAGKLRMLSVEAPIFCKFAPIFANREFLGKPDAASLFAMFSPKSRVA